MNTPPRPSTLGIVLHWTLAVLILSMLAIGFAAFPTSDPHKIGLLATHMMAGMAILALTLLRLVIRVQAGRRRGTVRKTGRLAAVSSLMQAGSYAVVLAMTGSGLAAAAMSGLNQIVFGGTGQPLPVSIDRYPAFGVHRALAIVLAVLVAAHVTIIAYEQFVRKSRPLARMSLQRTKPDAPSAEAGH